MAPLISILLQAALPFAVQKVAEQQREVQTVREIIMGFVRHAITTAGGGAAATGLISGDDVVAAAGAIATLAGVAWSVASKWLDSRKSA